MSRAAWKAFKAAHPELVDDVTYRIGEAVIGHHQGYSVEGVEVADVYEHDVCNHTISGDIDVEIAGNVQTFGFVATSGNMAGFEMLEWGDDAGVYEPPAPDPLIPIPPVGAHRGDWARWDRQRKEPWFQRLVSDRSYDAHFAPGAALGSRVGDQGDPVRRPARPEESPPADPCRKGGDVEASPCVRRRDHAPIAIPAP